MTPTDWQELQDAYNTIRSTSLLRLESPFWLIYRVGNVIRIDIKQ